MGALERIEVLAAKLNQMGDVSAREILRAEEQLKEVGAGLEINGPESGNYGIGYERFGGEWHISWDGQMASSASRACRVRCAAAIPSLLEQILTELTAHLKQLGLDK